MLPVEFRSQTVEWATPAALYAALNTEFCFDFDPCPIGGAVDGLDPQVQWEGRRVYCNPPYGRTVGDWIRRGLEALVAVYLLPARTDTKWFHELVLPNAREVRFIRGRLKFGDSIKDAPFPSIVVVFGGGQ